MVKRWQKYVILFFDSFFFTLHPQLNLACLIYRFSLMNNLEYKQDFYDDLIIQYLSGIISGEDLMILNAWLERKAENKHFFEQTREIWLSSKVAANPKGFDPGKGYQRFLSGVKDITLEDRRSIKNLSFSLSRVAAIFAVAFGLGILVHYLTGILSSDSMVTAQQEITVPLGSKTKIKLSDGTTVMLNAGSKLTYKTSYGKTNREVWLEGEGYFSVAKDKKRTFIVKTGYLDIKALGTEFNVKAYPNEKTIQTTLVEGSVKIEKIHQANSGETSKNPVILKPKQRYIFVIDSKEDVAKTDGEDGGIQQEDQKQKLVEAKTSVIYNNIDPVPDISWKDKRWIISKEQLGELAIKLERKYDVHINFADERLKLFRFTGTLQDESIEQVLKVMSLSAPIVFEIQGKQVIFHKNDEFAQKYKELYKS
jgi:transmembrane sensor